MLARPVDLEGATANEGSSIMGDRVRMITAVALAGTMGITLVTGAWGLQEVESQRRDVFSDVLDVRVVNVEVVVTDGHGNRVQGLSVEEFRLLVDGEEMLIGFFSEVRGGEVISDQETGSIDAVPAIVPGEPVGTSYLLFIDEFFPIESDRDHVLKKLKRQLNHLGPEDRMAVVAFDGHQLAMLSSWTGSVEALADALTEALGRPSHGGRRLGERREQDFINATSPRPTDPHDPEWMRLSADQRFLAERLVEQTRRMVGAAAVSLRSFASPPGRKVMLLLAGGWSYRPAVSVADQLQRDVLDRNLETGVELFAPLSDTANLLGYTLYPIDVAGRQSQPGASSAALSREASRRPVGFLRETDQHEAFRYVAGETGGRPFLNAQRDVSFEQVVSDTRSYYWLGFSPTKKGDDRRHRIEVEILRQGLQARARTGFSDLSPQRLAAMAMESGLYFGNPPTAEPLLVALGKPSQSGRKKIHLPVTVTIPVDSITLLPAGEQGFVADLELRVAVVDEDGSTVPVPAIPIAITLKEKPPAGQMLRYDTTLQMREKEHELVLALYDSISGATLSATVQMTP
jgi:VWFA-related protein